jgi:hypothetical protein
MVDILMTLFAERYALAFACYHDLHPQRHFPFALLVQVFKLSDVVHFHSFLGFAYFACVVL